MSDEEKEIHILREESGLQHHLADVYKMLADVYLKYGDYLAHVANVKEMKLEQKEKGRGT